MVALTQSDWRPYEQGTSGHWGRGRAPCDQVDSCLQAQDRGLGQALPHQGASEGASLAGAWISDSLPWGLGGHHCPPSWLPHLWGRSPKLTDAHGSLSPSDPGERCPQGAEHMQRACPGSRGHRPRPRSRPAPCLVLLPWGCHEAPGTSLHTDALRQSSPGLVMPALGLWAGCWAQPLAMTPEQPARGSNAHFRDTNAEAQNGQLTLSPGAV